MTAPSPGIIAAAMEDVFYGDMDAYLEALAAALKTEYDAIYSAGHVLQLDCPGSQVVEHDPQSKWRRILFLKRRLKLLSKHPCLHRTHLPLQQQ